MNGRDMMKRSAKGFNFGSVQGFAAAAVGVILFAFMLYLTVFAFFETTAYCSSVNFICFSIYLLLINLSFLYWGNRGNPLKMRILRYPPRLSGHLIYACYLPNRPHFSKSCVRPSRDKILLPHKPLRYSTELKTHMQLG